MDQEAWRAAVHGVTKSRTRLVTELKGGTHTNEWEARVTGHEHTCHHM